MSQKASQTKADVCAIEGSLRRHKGAKCLWAELVLRLHGQPRVGGRNGFVPIGRAGWLLNPWFLGNFVVFNVYKHNFLYFLEEAQQKAKGGAPQGREKPD